VEPTLGFTHFTRVKKVWTW